MDRIRAQAVERLLDKHRNLFPFSAKTRRGIGRPVAMLAMVLLPLLSGGGALQAGPSRTARGRTVAERSSCRSIRQIRR
jgi:hypothetical protein